LRLNKSEPRLGPLAQSGIATPREVAVALQASVYSGLDQLSATFRALFEQAGRRDFFLTLPWFETFTQTALDSGDRVRIYATAAALPQNGCDAILLARSSGKPHSSLSLRKLEGLANYYSCLYAPLVREGAESQAAIDAIARTIASEEPRWDAVELKPLDVNSEEFSELVSAFQNAGYVVQTFFASGNWYLPVNGRSFAQYAEDLPSVLRNTLNRKRKKLEKSGRAKIEIVTGGAGLGAAIETYTRVYLASWKQPEPYPGFIPALIRQCAAMGSLRLGIIHVDGEPAAAQLWIVHNHKALIYKLAYDERFGELSVGTILSATLFQHALDVDRVKEVDYLSGDDAYKKDWMSHRRERWGILALNPRTPRGALAIARHVGGRAVKNTARSLANRLRLRSSHSGTSS
jgi:GNAT acetyltransferase-like protein